MRIKLLALCMLVSLAGISCNRSDASEKANGQAKNDTETVEEQIPNVADIPDELVTEAVEYFGLLNDVERTYKVWLSTDDEPETGWERVTFLGFVDESPRFEFHRSGGLADLRDDIVELRKDGLYLVSTDLGPLKAPVLQIPSNVDVGSTWHSEMAIKHLETGKDFVQSMDFKIARVESTTVEAGTYSTLVVEVAIIVAPLTEQSDITIFYAKGIGVVLLNLSGVDDKGKPFRMRVELIDDGIEKTAEVEEEEE